MGKGERGGEGCERKRKIMKGHEEGRGSLYIKEDFLGKGMRKKVMGIDKSPGEMI